MSEMEGSDRMTWRREKEEKWREMEERNREKKRK